MYSDDTGLSQSADHERMAQYLDACQAAVDAWDEEASELAWSTLALERGWYDAGVRHARLSGTARADARIAMHTADGLL